jgi:thiol-disulfide isomerase/thioredoxin
MSKVTAIAAMVVLMMALVPVVGAQEGPKRYVGKFSEEEVLSHDERYADGAFSYIPDEEALAVFRSLSQPVLIRVFYRTDCGDSIQHVPAFIKTIQLADNPNIEVEYIGVNLEKDQPADLVSGWNIQLVPTFIVLKEGEEVGRVIETPKVKIEVDLAEILTAIEN